MLEPHWDALLALAWEDLCRRAVPRVARGALARIGQWQPAQRYWRGSEPEWDLVADAVEGNRTLLGEAWFSRRPATRVALEREAARLASRTAPPPTSGRQIVRALFVPQTQRGASRRIGDVLVVTLDEMI